MISQYIQRYKATKYDWCDLGDVLKSLTPKQYEKLLTKIDVDTELANCYIVLAEDRKENGSLEERAKRNLERIKAEKKEAIRAEKNAKAIEKLQGGGGEGMAR